MHTAPVLCSSFICCSAPSGEAGIGLYSSGSGTSTGNNNAGNNTPSSQPYQQQIGRQQSLNTTAKDANTPNLNQWTTHIFLIFLDNCQCACVWVCHRFCRRIVLFWFDLVVMEFCSQLVSFLNICNGENLSLSNFFFMANHYWHALHQNSFTLLPKQF